MKDLFKELKIDYKVINKATKEKIYTFQEKNGIQYSTNEEIAYQQRILVLKKLYKPSRQKSKKKLIS